MNRLNRLFAIHTFLQSRKYAPAEKIAEKFGISIRTVYRDVKSLGESGIPVSFEPARGYFLVPGHFLPPVAFSTEEAAALLLMEGATQIFADRGIQTHYTSALTKVKAVLRAAQKDDVEALTSRTAVQFPACMTADFEYLPLLQKSIAARTVLEILYANKAGEESLRTVEPIGLVFYAMAWHVAAWCHRREAYRDFRVSRIQRARCTGRPFTKAEHMPLAEYMKELPVDY